MASSFGMDIGDEDNAYGLVRTLKTKLRGIVKKGDRCEVHLTNYPESPSDLPRPIFEHAYPSGHEPPLDQLAIGAPSGASPTSIPLRCSNAKLRRNSTDSKQGTGSRNPPQDAWPNTPQDMMGMCNMWMQGMQGMMMQAMRGQNVQGQNAGGQANLANLNINKRKALSAATPLAITAGSQDPAGDTSREKEEPGAEAAQEQEQPGTEAAPKGTAEAGKGGLTLPVVNPVLEALQARDDEKAEVKQQSKAKAKPKAKGKATCKAKAKVMAKPKANVQAKPKAKSSSVFLKKPASAVAARNGWLVESRVRGTGQIDKHYLSPDGKIYRTIGDARSNGFIG